MWTAVQVVCEVLLTATHKQKRTDRSDRIGNSESRKRTAGASAKDCALAGFEPSFFAWVFCCRFASPPAPRSVATQESIDMTPPLPHPLAFIGAAVLVALPLSAQEVEPRTGAGSGNVLLSATAIPYEEIAPGIERAVLYGNPEAEGEPFTFRLRITGSFEMEPHLHPVPEHMTVLSGRFFVGVGEVLDRTKAVEYGPGAYVVIDAGVPAYMWTEGATVVQVHGVGPLRTVPVAPRDPPR